MSLDELNPTTTHFEFLGPPGALLVSLGVPITTYALYFACSESTGLTTLALWDTEAAIAYLAWYAFCVLAWAVLPGDHVVGTRLRDGAQKTYKINGTTLLNNPDSSHFHLHLAFSSFLLALGLTSGVILRCGPESFTFIYDKWVGLVTASLLMSLVQAVYCYVTSFKPNKLLALGGNSGNVLYDVCSLIL